MLLALGAPPLVAEFAMLLISAALFGYLAIRVGLESIVGFLVAGAIVGPNALELIEDVELVDQMAEIGVIFLMFAIGLELSGEKLRKMGSLMLGGGSLQVGLTIAMVTGLCALWGVDIKSGLYTGCLVALSSTAVVLKLLQSRGTTETETGQVAVAFLIFQDIAVVLLVLLVPMLGDGGGEFSDIVAALAKAVIVIVALLLGSRLLVNPFLNAVDRESDDEIFLFAVLAVAAGYAWLVTFFGLTPSLGAFIGGLAVSAGPFRHRSAKLVLPFQAVFAAVFFASIGMQLDLGFAADNLLLVAILAIGGLVVKSVGVGVAARAFGQQPAVVVASAVLLAQIGEFSFVLQKVGLGAGLSVAGQGADGDQAFIATTVVMIAVTPALYKLAGIAGARVLRRSVDQTRATGAGTDT
jgi:CPA2 family monovalent cation:H+ antiporter-2